MSYIKIILSTIAMTMTTIASAATAPKTEQGGIAWNISTGLGYDSNAYQAPRSSYIDYAALPLGLNPTVVPQKKSGIFVPFEINPDNPLAELKYSERVEVYPIPNGIH